MYTSNKHTHITTIHYSVSVCGLSYICSAENPMISYVLVCVDGVWAMTMTLTMTMMVMIIGRHKTKHTHKNERRTLKRPIYAERLFVIYVRMSGIHAKMFHISKSTGRSCESGWHSSKLFFMCLRV